MCTAPSTRHVRDRERQAPRSIDSCSLASARRRANEARDSAGNFRGPERPGAGRAQGNVFRSSSPCPVDAMRRKDILRKLEERLARGEINEKTYLEIKARYESEPDEPEDLGESTLPDLGLGATIGNAVAQATAEASRVAGEATRFVGDTMRAIDFTGVVSGRSAKLSDESIKIVGSGVVRGNPIRTVEFKSAGSARVQGTLIAKVAGSCVFEGDVEVEQFRSAGSVHILGNLKAESVEASGALQVDGSVHAEQISSGG